MSWEFISRRKNLEFGLSGKLLLKTCEMGGILKVRWVFYFLKKEWISFQGSRREENNISKNVNEETVSKETYFGWLVEAEYSLKRMEGSLTS